MEHQKILNLLIEANYSKFVASKWNIANDQSNASYDVENKIICNTEVLKSNLCDFNDAYILVRGDIPVTTAPETLSFKTRAPFTKSIGKIDGTIIDGAEDFDLVMPIYSLIHYSSYYSKATGSLWFYSKDEATNFNVDIANPDNFKSFKYKTKLSESKSAQPAPNQAN